MLHTDVSAGNVSGTWTAARSPYHVLGDITIPDDSTLTIEPGVDFVFMGCHKLHVQGRLLAVGTQQDSIRFTTEETQTGWHGIRFADTPNTNDTSKFIYCSFTHGKAMSGTGDDRCGGAMFIRGFSKIIVSQSLFDANSNEGGIASTGGAVIYIDHASPIITRSTFSRNTGTTDCGIMASYSDALIAQNVFSRNNGSHGPVVCAYGSPTIAGNFISGNAATRAGVGIFTMTTTATIANNIIFHNECIGEEGEGGGIRSWGGDRALIINNTIGLNRADFWGGLCCSQDADPTMVNTVLWGNTATYGYQIGLLEPASDPAFISCVIEGGRDGFGGAGSGTAYNGRYERNMDIEPAFVDAPSGDYRLSDISPCICAGMDSIQQGAVWYTAPSEDFYGGLRPNPAGSHTDIGACESPRSAPVTAVHHRMNRTPPQCELLHNYPNPFNPTTNVQFSLSARQWTTLNVYDVLGCVVATLVDEVMDPGSHTVRWNAGGVPSGVYICRLQAGSFVDTKKLVLVR
ncbi:MAG: T9SS type A sorting domain-containing protein [Acidobacteriota bacterium]